MGLLGEVVTNISTELQELLIGVKQRREPAALQDTGTLQIQRITQKKLGLSNNEITQIP